MALLQKVGLKIKPEMFITSSNNPNPERAREEAVKMHMERIRSWIQKTNPNIYDHEPIYLLSSDGRTWVTVLLCLVLVYEHEH